MKRFLLATAALVALVSVDVTAANAQNTAALYQFGYGNSGSFNQHGHRNRGTLRMNGDYNYTRAVQQGDWNYLYHQQLGNRNRAMTDQFGDKNYAVTGQQGANNAAAFLAEISVAQLLKSSDHFYFFLDTEPRPGPALTIQYYSGWSQALIAKGLELSNGKITFKPGVYLNHGDDETCRNLTSAIQSSHAECAGLVVARYLKQSTLKAPEWKDATVNPNIQVPRPSLMWQYVGDLGPSQVFDGLEMNPNFNDVFSHLAIP